MHIVILCDVFERTRDEELVPLEAGLSCKTCKCCVGKTAQIRIDPVRIKRWEKRVPAVSGSGDKSSPHSSDIDVTACLNRLSSHSLGRKTTPTVVDVIYMIAVAFTAVIVGWFSIEEQGQKST